MYKITSDVNQRLFYTDSREDSNLGKSSDTGTAFSSKAKLQLPGLIQTK